MPTMTPEQYLKDRVEDQIRWYGDKSRSNQKTYNRLRTLEIVLAASIPFFVGNVDAVPYLKLVTGVSGVIVAVVAGVFSLYRFHENWVAYRNTGETLKREKFLYLTGAPPYNAADAFQQLVARCEAVMGAENEKWTTLFSSTQQEGQQAPPAAQPAAPQDTPPASTMSPEAT